MAPQPLRLTTETVTEVGDLLLRLPEGEEGGELPGPLTVLSGEEPVQRVEPAAYRGGATVRYPIAQIGGTAAVHRHLRIVAPYRGRVLPVAVVSPRRLATGAHQEDGAVVLADFPGLPGVDAALYPHRAPWRTPRVVPVSEDGRVELPEDLRDGGPLEGLLAVDDPWSAAEWPGWPDRRDANRLTCPAPGVPASDDPDEELLSRVLAGEADAARLRVTDETAARLWRVVGLADRLTAVGVDRAAVDACARVLGEHPVTALLAHGSAGLAPPTASAPSSPAAWPPHPSTTGSPWTRRSGCGSGCPPRPPWPPATCCPASPPTRPGSRPSTPNCWRSWSTVAGPPPRSCWRAGTTRTPASTASAPPPNTSPACPRRSSGPCGGPPG